MITIVVHYLIMGTPRGQIHVLSCFGINREDEKSL